MNDYFISNEEQERVEALPYAIPSKLREILKGFKWAIRKKNTSAVMLIDGKSGLGKSTLSFQIGKYCDPNFCLDNVYFNPDQFLDGLSNAKPFSIHIFDEALLVSARSAMSTFNRAVIQAMSMIRSKNIIVIFCVNSIFDLDRNLVLSRADILLHLYGDSLTDRGKFMAFFKADDEFGDRLKLLYLLGKKYYDYRKPHSNFNTTFSSYMVLDEILYEEKKQQGVNEFLRGGTRENNSNLKEMFMKLLAYTYNELKIPQSEMIKALDVNQQTLNYWYGKIKPRKSDGNLP